METNFHPGFVNLNKNYAKIEAKRIIKLITPVLKQMVKDELENLIESGKSLSLQEMGELKATLKKQYYIAMDKVDKKNDEHIQNLRAEIKDSIKEIQDSQTAIEAQNQKWENERMPYKFKYTNYDKVKNGKKNFLMINASKRWEKYDIFTLIKNYNIFAKYNKRRIILFIYAISFYFVLY